MHSYRRIAQGDGNYLWVVGYLNPPDGWTTLRDFPTETAAAEYVSYLNGGEHPRKPWSSAIE